MKLREFVEELEKLGFDIICEHITKKGGIYLEFGNFNLTIQGNLLSEKDFTIDLYTEDDVVNLEIKHKSNKLFKSHLDIITTIVNNIEI